MTHYYEPERVAKTVGNRKACCTRPAADHPVFPDGQTFTVRATRDIRTSMLSVRKGQTLTARAEFYDTERYVSEGRWGTNELGQFAQIEKPVFESVRVPGWVVQHDDRTSTGLPVRYLQIISQIGA